jgi:DNA-directed RNA polymerase specialized sigma24 family protein
MPMNAAFVSALQRLAQSERAVFVLTDVFVWDSTDVAELLDLPADSVDEALVRARAIMSDPQPYRGG